jgi:transaldolase
MKAKQKRHDAGQSHWHDNITRELLTRGALQGCIDELSVAGPTSSPTIFDQASRVRELGRDAQREKEEAAT